MLTLEQLRNPSDEELARFDLAAVDLAYALGLPGPVEIKAESCGVDAEPFEDFGGKFGSVSAIHTIHTNRPGVPFVSDNGVVLDGQRIS